MGRLYIRELRIVMKEPRGALAAQALSVAGRLKGDVQVSIQSVGGIGVSQTAMGTLQAALEVWHMGMAAPQTGVAGDADDSKEGILWLTDCEHTAGLLLEEKLPVMVWLHEGNSHCSFSKVRYALEDPGELDADFYDKIYRRFRGIPWEIAETDRCILRETMVSDVDALLGIYADPEITKYTDSFCTEPHREREYVKEYIEKAYAFFGYGVWTVVWKQTGEVIGRVGFEPPTAAEEAGEGSVHEDGVSEDGEQLPRLLSLGYMIAGPWQGKGIALEVCRAALDFAKKELQVSGVQVLIDAGNKASLRLAESLGFQGEYVTVKKTGRQCFHGILRFLGEE